MDAEGRVQRNETFTGAAATSVPGYTKYAAMADDLVDGGYLNVDGVGPTSTKAGSGAGRAGAAKTALFPEDVEVSKKLQVPA